MKLIALLIFVISCKPDSSYQSGYMGYGDHTTSEVPSSQITYDQTDDDNSNPGGFGEGTHSGTSYSSGKLSLTSDVNLSSLDPTWTPNYQNIVAYWKMDEASWNGTAEEVVDSSGNGNHGIKVSNATVTSAAKIGEYAGAFDGVGGYVQTGTNNIPIGGSARSVSYWVYPVSNGGVVATFNTAAGQKFCVEVVHWGSDWYLFSDGVNAGNNIIITGNEIPELNQWTHISFTLDDSNNWKYYKNGALLRTGTFATAINTSPLTSITIGDRLDFSFPFNGKIDDFAIWDIELPSDDIVTIYNRQKTKFSGIFTSRVMNSYDASSSWSSLNVNTSLPFYKEITGDEDGDSAADSETSISYSEASGSLSSNLVGLWHLNGDADDASGTGANGIITGATSTTDAKFNSALRFNGSNNYVAVPDNDAFSFGDTVNDSPFSISIWIKRTGIPSNEFSGIISKDNSGSDREWALIFLKSTSELRFFIKDNGGNNQQSVNFTQTLPVDKWTHVAVTYDGRGGASAYQGMKIYFNGKEDVPQGVLSNSYTAMKNTTATIEIGRYASTNAYQFPGIMDEAAIWQREITSAEVLTLYRRGANCLKYQVRTCDDNLCSGENWGGPDGTTSTYFSELHNRKMAGVYSATGNVQTDPLQIIFSEFSALTNNQYFQYRVIMESDDENNLCASATCVPSIESVVVGPER